MVGAVWFRGVHIGGRDDMWCSTKVIVYLQLARRASVWEAKTTTASIAHSDRSLKFHPVTRTSQPDSPREWRKMTAFS